MRALRTPFLAFFLFLIVLGIGYPFLITGLSQLFFPTKANGSLITMNGTVVGSLLVGQKFSKERYFIGRPSVPDYDAVHSGGSNLGPLSKKLIDDVAVRITEVRKREGLPPDQAVPADLVLASASGLDPHLSIPSALLQVPRVARERGVPEEKIVALITRMTETGSLGAGPHVNVLKLNIALDEVSAR